MITIFYAAVVDGSKWFGISLPTSCDVGYKYFTVFDGYQTKAQPAEAARVLTPVRQNIS